LAGYLFFGKPEDMRWLCSQESKTILDSRSGGGKKGVLQLLRKAATSTPSIPS
jgi:hypothetical protein